MYIAQSKVVTSTKEDSNTTYEMASAFCVSKVEMTPISSKNWKVRDEASFQSVRRYANGDMYEGLKIVVLTTRSFV